MYDVVTTGRQTTCLKRKSVILQVPRKALAVRRSFIGCAQLWRSYIVSHLLVRLENTYSGILLHYLAQVLSTESPGAEKKGRCLDLHSTSESNICINMTI